MFGFLNMSGNYDSRKVDRYEDGEMFISTAKVTDSSHPYETAVAHPRFNSGDIVIVETYDSRKEAEEGHERWVKTMTAEKLPESLQDVSTCEIVQFASALGMDLNEEHKAV